MHAKRRRQMAQRLWNGPIAHAFLPRRQYNLARKNNVDAISGLDLGREQSASRRRDLDDLTTVTYRQGHHPPEPEQILRPKLTRNKGEISPTLLAEARLVPRPIGHAGNIQIVTVRNARTAH